MLPRVPEEGGGPARVSRGRDDLEIVVQSVTLGEGLVDVAGLDTDRASSSWQCNGAPNVLATQSQAGEASWRWFRYWREMPPKSLISSTSRSSVSAL